MEQDSYIDELTTAGTLTGTEQVVLFQSDATVQATLAAIRAYLKTAGYEPRVTTIVTGAAPTPDAGTTDIYEITTLDVNATIGNPTGAPADGKELIMRIKDNGISHTLAFGAQYNFSSSLTAPASTTANKWLYMRFIYRSNGTKWDCVLKLDNFSI